MARRAAIARLLLTACWGLLACTDPAAIRERALEEASAARAIGALGRAAEILESALAYDPADAAIAIPLAEVELANGDARSALQTLRPLDAASRTLRTARAVEGRAWLAQGAALSAARILAAPDLAPTLSASERGELLGRLATQTDISPEDLAIPDEWERELVTAFVSAGKRCAAVRWLDSVADPVERERLADAVVVGWLDAGAPQSDAAAIRPLVAQPRSGAQLLALRRLQVGDGDLASANASELQFLRDYAEHAGRAEILLEQAERAYATGDFERALGLAREAGRLDPRQPRAPRIVGLSLKARGRLVEARHALTIARDLAPADRAVNDALDELLEGGREREARSPRIKLDLELEGEQRR